VTEAYLHDDFVRDYMALPRSAVHASMNGSGNGRPLSYFTMKDAAPHLDADDFVEGLLTSGAMSVIYGESNSGKTFFASDLALRVALGWRWRDRDVERGGVLFIALEGGHGIRNRLAAFRHEYGLDQQDVPFAVVTTAVNFLDPGADTASVITTVKAVATRFDVPVRLVVVDTLSRAMAGGNENANEDMSALVRSGDLIRQETGAHLIWIHHSGKDAAKGARGHSSLRAALDTEIEVTADGSRRLAKVTKQRDLACAGEFPFTLRVVELGMNRRGKPVTSCVVEVGELHPGDRASRTSQLTGQKKRALEVLTDLLASSGKVGVLGCPAGVASVPAKRWREQFYERAMPGAESDAKQKAFVRASDYLVAEHHVGMASDFVWLSRAPNRDGEAANDAV